MSKSRRTIEVGLPINGRNAAYVARNREALLSKAIEVFSTLGPEATVEEIADHAKVSVTTIYGHFTSKEMLFEAALTKAFIDWTIWADDVVGKNGKTLAGFVMMPRMFFRMRDTHPLYANAARSNFAAFVENSEIFSTEFKNLATQLLKSGELEMDNPKIRLENFFSMILGIFQRVVTDPRMSFKEADLALELALGMLGISSAKAKKLAHAPLPKPLP